MAETARNINSYKELYSSCTLCPRECKVDRRKTVGVCGASDRMKTVKVMLHRYEEPALTGGTGESGAIFFSGCSLHCVYCQNREISFSDKGKVIGSGELYEIFQDLMEKGARNIDLVTPDHFLPEIIPVLEKAKKEGFPLPVVYNCSGYQSTKSLKLLDGLVDVYLPDFKYFSADAAVKYSKSLDYYEVCAAAIDEMFRQRGAPKFDDGGRMTSGLLIRHLLLPGRVIDAKRILLYLHKKYGDDIYISIMSQYYPMGKDLPDEISRKLTFKEYKSVVDYADSIGIKNAFIQGISSASEDYIPDFNTLE